MVEGFVCSHNGNICRYILMAEPDHVFVKPLPNLAHGDEPAAFPFFYIKLPQYLLILSWFDVEKWKCCWFITMR